MEKGRVHTSSPNQYLQEAEIYQHTNNGRRKSEVQHIIEYISLPGNSNNECADSNRRTPNYDLAKINLALPDQLLAAEITRIEIPLVQTDEKSGTYGKIILILGSILGVLIVFYFGSSLLKDMKKEENRR